MILATFLSMTLLVQPTGPYETRSSPNNTIKDSARNKDIEFRVTFPVEKGKFPLIMLSHGLGGSKDALLPLSEFWARHGFIVIQPTHSDSMKYASPAQRADFLQKDLSRLTGDWKSRPEDIRYLLDNIEKVIAGIKDMKSRPDMTKIGVAGHSFGAHTAMLLSGVRTYALARSNSHLDKRIKCALLISPQGRGPQLRPTSWNDCRLPMMTISGSEDRDPLAKQEPEWRQDPFKLSPPGDKYLVWIEGAHHGFGGINGQQRFSGSGPDIPDHVRIVQLSSLAFWEKYLNNNDTKELAPDKSLKNGAAKYSISVR